MGPRLTDEPVAAPVPSPDPSGAAPASTSGEARPIRVFVHLARNKDAAEWARAHAAGTLIGVNDPTPYGYGRASAMGCEVAFSRSGPESLPARLLRLGLRAVTGFDLLHARRQRSAMMAADVVWTHTESQFLAVAAVLPRHGPRPRLLGQSIWLMDRWSRLSPPRRALYRRLIDRVDLLTFHSPDNLARARRLFPDRPAALVRFGIPSERHAPPRPRPGRPLRVLAPGNDRHRDWRTLVEAVAGEPDTSLTILSGTAPARLAGPTVRIAQPASAGELDAAYAEASLVVVPLHPNQHASGITVIQEAVLAGVPVIASDTGGLRAYFGPDELTYVPPGDAAALRAAIRALGADPEGARGQARRAQTRLLDGTLGAEAFVRRHVELSQQMLGKEMLDR